MKTLPCPFCGGADIEAIPADDKKVCYELFRLRPLSVMTKRELIGAYPDIGLAKRAQESWSRLLKNVRV